MTTTTPITPFKPRPTNYQGHQMRSRLEAGFAQWLDGMGWEWDYEPECFAGPGGQWLPDFRVHVECVWHTIEDELVTAEPIYVEVKPSIFTVQESRALRPRMAMLHLSEPNAAAVIAQQGTAPVVLLEDGLQTEPLDWTWTGLWPIDARSVRGPWPNEWWKGVAL